jgi:hypothetical protein
MDKKQIAFENFLKAQIKFLEESKWYEGERRKCDPGQEFIIESITKNSDTFRRRWDYSKCKDCEIGWKCGNLLKTICPEFKPL